MVEGFLRNVAAAAGWIIGPGPAERISAVTAGTGLLPLPLGGAASRLVSVDGKATAGARAAGAETEGIVTIGPTETTFRDLLALCADQFAPDLYRGAVVQDQASTSPYALYVFTIELHTFDGITKASRPQPFLIRYSGGSAFAVDWTSVANLRPLGGTATRPAPGARVAAAEAAEVEPAQLSNKPPMSNVDG